MDSRAASPRVEFLNPINNLAFIVRRSGHNSTLLAGLILRGFERSKKSHIYQSE